MKSRRAVLWTFLVILMVAPDHRELFFLKSALDYRFTLDA